VVTQDAAPYPPGSQLFELRRVPLLSNGFYTIASQLDPTKVLDVAGGATGNGGLVQLYASNDTNSQKWMLTAVGTNRYVLRAANSGKVLDVPGSLTYNGNRLQQWGYSGNAGQCWDLVYKSGGFVLHSALNGGFVLDVAGGSTANGTAITLYEANSSAAQRFRLSPTSNWPSGAWAREAMNYTADARGLTAFGYDFPALSSASYSRLSSAIREYEGSGQALGFIMVDVKSGRGVSYMPDTLRYSASTLKGPFVASQLALNPSSYWAGSSRMADTITVSNNDTYASLWNQYGNWTFVQWCERSEVPAARASFKYGYISPKELAKLWTSNYDYFFSGAEHSAWAASLYTSPLNSGIHWALGSTYTSYTKPGWIGSPPATDDAGIVMAGSGTRPYIVSIMTTAPANPAKMNSLVWAIDQAHNELM
jgi:hypothetical protein